jgi:hypothetical protein
MKNAISGWLLGAGVSVSLLFAGFSISWAGKLEDTLLENKQITIDQWMAIKAEEEKQEAKALQESRGASGVPLRERWYEKISIRGYAQFRYNYTIDNDLLRSNPGDRSIGANNEFFIRRGRLIISAQPHERVFIYLQPEFAGLVGGSEQIVGLRDFYADLFLTENKEWRIRAGLSKTPYGFENVQSSQIRLAFDRNDALNSGVVNERDLGVYLYYTPTVVRERFRRLADSGLKGSGDYGMLGIGVYNGQGISVRDRNKNKHVVFHATYPYEFPNGQMIQFGMDAYTGQFNVATQPVIPVSPINSTSSGQRLSFNPLLHNDGNYLDQRIAWHFILYPQPFGLQAEYTIGRGPELNTDRNEVVPGNIRGGYVQLFYHYKCDSFCLSIFPYVRYQEYFGGKKFEANSPRNSVRELELGIEYQLNKAIEFTVAGTLGSRNTPDAQFLPTSCTNSLPGANISCFQTPYERQSGSLLRFQLQWNF